MLAVPPFPSRAKAMRNNEKMHALLEQLFGGDMVAGTFKTVVWLIAAVLIASVIQSLSV